MEVEYIVSSKAADFSYFFDQNYPHIFEEFGVHLLLCDQKKVKAAPSTFLPEKADKQRIM